MNKDNLAITALIGSYDGSELEGLDPLKEGDDYFFPAIECAKRLGYHNPRDAIRRHCKRETKTVDEIVVTGNRLTSKPEGRQRCGAGDTSQIHMRGGLLSAAVPFPDAHRGTVRRLVADRFPVSGWIEVLPSIRANGSYYGKRFTDLLRRSLQAEKEEKAGMITQEEAEAISKAFYEAVDILAEKIKRMRGKEPSAS